MEKLLTLPGVARKTANVVLGTWFKKAEGIVVDTHVHRISRRLELTANSDPQKIEQDLMRIIPREKWILFSHQIIWHGRNYASPASRSVSIVRSKTSATPPTKPGARSTCTRTRKRNPEFLCYTFSSITFSSIHVPEASIPCALRTLCYRHTHEHSVAKARRTDPARAQGHHRSQEDRLQAERAGRAAQPDHREALHDAPGGTRHVVPRRQERCLHLQHERTKNLWLVPAEGGWPVQLTVSDQRQTAPAWSPDGKWIAYQSDYDGDEQWDIFLVSPKTGKVVNLTSTREIAETDPTWSPDGRYLAYLVKPKTSAAHEIDVYDTLMREVKHITTGTPQDKGNFNPIWSKDGKFIVYTQEQAKGTDSNIFIADVQRERARCSRRTTESSAIQTMTFRPMANTFCSLRTPPTATKTLACWRLPPRKSRGSRKTNGKFAAANSHPTASTSPSAQTSTAVKTFTCRSGDG